MILLRDCVVCTLEDLEKVEEALRLMGSLPVYAELHKAGLFTAVSKFRDSVRALRRRVNADEVENGSR